MNVTPTAAQIDAGFDAGRKALDAYSSFDSAMVPDAALLTFVTEVAAAVLNTPTPTETTPNA